MPDDGGLQGFRLLAMGNKTLKYSGTEQKLRLVWMAENKAFECFQGALNLTAVSSNFRVPPSDISMLTYSEDSRRVLLESLNGNQTVSLFLKFSHQREVEDFYNFLAATSDNEVKHRVVSR